MKKLVSGFILGSVLLAGSASTALATPEGAGHTPVSYCHNGVFITTDDDGATNGHKTGKGIHANDVFAEDLGREVTAADCKGPVDRPTIPRTEPTVESQSELDCVAGLKVVTDVTSIVKYKLNEEENVWEAVLPAEIISSSQITVPTTAEDCPTDIPPHGEPDPTNPAPVTPEPGTPEPVVETYPAPPVTPNTVNGTPVAPVAPAPSGVAEAADVSTGPESSQLANTGANSWMILWAAVGFAALLAGIVSVVLVRRNA